MKALKNCCPATITIAMASARINLLLLLLYLIYIARFFFALFIAVCIFWGQMQPTALLASASSSASSLFASYYVRNLSRVLFFRYFGVCVGRIFRKRKIMNIYPATIPANRPPPSCAQCPHL